MSSREDILARLRAAQKPFPAAKAVDDYLAVTPLDTDDNEKLTARFIEEAQKLTCTVHRAEDEAAATLKILTLLDGEKRILAWDFDHIPCQPLDSALHEAGVAVLAANDPTAQVGITGADAALAATGSLVMVSGSGRQRAVSLLPETHIAVICEAQILPNMESWMSKQRQHNLAAFDEATNINIISGPSRTADIAMELILGMHGPKALHIVIIAS